MPAGSSMNGRALRSISAGGTTTFSAGMGWRGSAPANTSEHSGRITPSRSRGESSRGLARRLDLKQRQTRSKSLSEADKYEGLSPSRTLKLDTLQGVRSEMARLYRLAIKEKLRTDELTRLVYCLKEIRACIEVEVLERVEGRLEVLSD